jgi:carbohydrate-binding DOMON domain-containing protein
VPKVVKAKIWTIGGLSDAIPRLVDVVPRVKASFGAREHKVTEITVARLPRPHETCNILAEDSSYEDPPAFSSLDMLGRNDPTRRTIA